MIIVIVIIMIIIIMRIIIIIIIILTHMGSWRGNSGERKRTVVEQWITC